MNPNEIWIFVDETDSPFVREEIVFYAQQYSAVRLFSRKPLNVKGLEAYVQEASVVPHQRGPLSDLLQPRLWAWWLKDLFSKSSSFAYLRRARYNLSYLMRCAGAANALEKRLQACGSQRPVLLSYWFADWALTLSWLKAKGAIRAFYSRAHGRDVFEDREPTTGKLPYRSQQLASAERVFTVSQAGCSYLQEKYPRFAGKIELQYLGTRDHGIGAFDPEARPTLITCARVRNVKRIYLMPQILQHMQTPVRWVHIGDENLQAVNDPTMPLYKAGKEALREMPQVEAMFTGSLDNAAIFDFYRNNTVNLFLNLSSTEGLPFVLIEAISMGIPVLATDVGGCREIAHAETGLLVEADPDPRELAAKVDAFLQSDQNTAHFRAGVRRYWENHFRLEDNLLKFVQTAKQTA